MSFVKSVIFGFSVLATFYILIAIVGAQEFTSSSFKVLDPIINPGGYSTSDDYRLNVVISQPTIGTSTDTDFRVSAGFLYFPFVSTPTVTASAGNGQVDLSWTAATGALGWTVSGYSVGQSTTAGGPYTYTSLGNVISSTRSGLNNGTTYYFVINPEDAFGNRIATSTEVSSAPVAPAPAPSPAPSGGGGGGGGGGYIAPSGATVNFSGRAYPKSTVFILKDAVIAIRTIAGADASFSATLASLNGGHYLFSVYAEGYQGRRSSISTFPIIIPSGGTVNVGGIFLAPTIGVNKSEVKRGNSINIFGQSVNSAEIVIQVNSEQEIFSRTKSDKDGIYLYAFNTQQLDIGQHLTKSYAVLDSKEISDVSSAIAFRVGTQDVDAAPIKKCPPKGDLNNDCRVNLIDFSIAAYWWDRPLTIAAKDNIDKLLYADGKITLRDFSIMAFYWTG